MSENSVVVIDPGSLVLKAGYGGEDTPTVTINNAIGFSKDQEEKDNFLCGEELQAKKEALSIKYPVVDGIVTNIDDFEKILQYVFDNELKITPEENNILLSESIVNPKPIREKMGQILFETFNSLSVYIAAQPLLALYSAGYTTGVVVDIGDGICHTTPFNEGYVVHSGVYNTSLSGKKLTEYLSELLAQKGNYNINFEKIREIKEELCFTSFDYEEQTRKMGLKSNDIDRNYALPDGQIISLGVERFKCAELLFKPQLFGIESIGIHETIYNSLASCDPETRSEVAQHIIITGGTSTMTGFQDRLQRELTALSPLRYKMKVNTTSERKYGVWNGGAILGSINAFQNMWITKQDYDETGPTIVNRKCF